MKIKRIGLTTRTLVVLSLFMLLFASIQGMILVNQSKTALKAQIRERMLDISNTAAAALNGDEIVTLRPGDEGTPAYRSVMVTLALFRDNIDLKYVYLLRDEGDGRFTFICDSDPIAPAYFGEQATYTEALYHASLGTADVDKEAYKDRWGRFYSAYSPVFDSSGSVAGILCVDFSAQWYDDQISMHMRTLLILDILAVLLGVLLIVFFGRRTNRSLSELSGELSELGSDVDTLTNEVALTLCLSEEETTEAKLSPDDAPKDTDELEGKIHTMHRTLRKYIEYMNERAYKDFMTGLGNKGAYLEYVGTLEDAPRYSVAVFDVNGLKNINDTFGHDCGDMVVVDAAAIIKRCFGTEHVYRVGGDEFVAIQEGAESVSSLFSALDADLAAFNAGKRRYEAELALSKGAADYIPGQDKDFTEVFQRADKAMYADKAAYYAVHGDRRRRT